MAYVQFEDGEELSSIRAKLNTGILEIEQTTANAQADATTALQLIVPLETVIDSDTISINLDRARKTTAARTPAGNVTLNIESANQVDGAFHQFAVVMDGIKSINFTGSGYKLFNITNGEVLESGTYDVQCWRMRGITYINFPDNISTAGTTPDVSNPTVAITSNQSGTTSVNPIPITITFSEVVTGFVAGDITVGNGTAGNFAGSGATYTADITPAAEGAVTVDVAADVAIDGAGNGNDAATQFSITYQLVDTSVELTFPTLSSITKSGLVYTSTGDFSVAFGLSNLKAVANADFWVQHQITNINWKILGLNKQNNNEQFGSNYEYYTSVNSSGFITRGTNGATSTSTGVSAQVGDIIRLQRVSGTLTLMRSTDGGSNFTTLHTFGVDNSEFFFNINLLQAGFTIETLRANGVVTV